MVTLITAYRGYTNGDLTGNRDGNHFEIVLSSGARIWVYEDEFLR